MMTLLPRLLSPRRVPLLLRRPPTPPHTTTTTTTTIRYLSTTTAHASPPHTPAPKGRRLPHHYASTHRVKSRKEAYWDALKQDMEKPHKQKEGGGSPYVISDSDDDDDGMLAHAIKLSLGKGTAAGKGKRKADAIVISDDESDGQHTGAGGGGGGGGGTSSMGMDRARMERERLERLGRGYLVSATGGQRKSFGEREKHEEREPSPESASASAFYSSLAVAAAEARQLEIETSGASASTPAVKKTAPGWTKPNPMNLPFAGGAVKKTWALGQPRTGDDIKFEELLDPATIYGAVLSAFQWDFEWVFSKIPPKKLQRFVLVLQAKNQADKDLYTKNFGGFPGSDLVFPPMDEANIMHGKLQLLFHKRAGTADDWLRVVVPSANLTSYDWGETGTMENMLFVIDLPRLPAPEASSLQFPTELARFCRAMGIPKDVLARLDMYDFSATARMAFVHTIGGAHYDKDIRQNTGYPGLGRAIRQLGYASPTGHEVDFVTSSLGATHQDFVMNMYNAAMGCDGSRELARRPPPPPPPKKKKKKKKGSAGPSGPSGYSSAAPSSPPPSEDEAEGEQQEEEVSWDNVKERFRIYFPSHETVRRSFGGLDGAGTITFVQDQWDAPSYPQALLRDCESVRAGLVMHSKMMLVRPPVPLRTPGGTLDAWAYVGSANLSESAWGKLVLNRATKEPKIKIKCRNWECGVVVPVFSPPSSSSEAAEERAAPLGMEVFGGAVPVPMATPAPALGKARPPWFVAEIYELRRKVLKGEERKRRKEARSMSRERGTGWEAGAGEAKKKVWEQRGRRW